VGSIRIVPKRRFGQFLIYKPATVEIDGVIAGSVKWRNETAFTVAPGTHEVTVSFAYFGKPRLGVATTSVTATDTSITSLLYRTPLIVTGKGSLTAQ
jgi:hypothetical protein